MTQGVLPCASVESAWCVCVCLSVCLSLSLSLSLSLCVCVCVSRERRYRDGLRQAMTEIIVCQIHLQTSAVSSLCTFLALSLSLSLSVNLPLLSQEMNKYLCERLGSEESSVVTESNEDCAVA